MTVVISNKVSPGKPMAADWRPELPGEERRLTGGTNMRLDVNFKKPEKSA
jgi:hypothetical protein